MMNQGALQGQVINNKTPAERKLPWSGNEQTDWVVCQHLQVYSSSLQFEASHADEPITFLSLSESVLYVFHLGEP